MLHRHTLAAQRAALLVIDMQEAFRQAIPDFAEIAARTARLVAGAKLLGVPLLVTEQYPKGLGHTVAEISDAAGLDFKPIEKTSFSSCGADAFIERLRRTGAEQLLVCGIEAHVCVNQTAHDLLARGFQVHLALDCISSRTMDDKQAGLRKLQQSGALASSVELALFELLRDARHEQFKAIQKLIK